ncbi:MAG: DUF134 domain-containing protein [Bacteroidales bacterium]|jgi:predicted DNA-binding protein (UPF0251 family)|nr:DUF134 domain-containing protein [Bacteroidales bacterium]MCI2146101.1 DUF134 domain-containing protein [Bacteroidales bacterium]
MMENPPVVEGFKPFGVPFSATEPVVLLFEEYEAIRLVDYEGLTQEDASVKMNVSRPTFTRIYDKAKHTIATGFVEGRPILVRGGDYQSKGYWYRCEDCNRIIVSATEILRCVYCNSKRLRTLSSLPCNGRGFCRKYGNHDIR